MQQSLQLFIENGDSAILSLLSDRKWHSSRELSELDLQYNRAVYDLRKKGYNIVSMRNEGCYGFELRGVL